MTLLTYIIQVNENGVVSFKEAWKYSHPITFPTDNVFTRQGYVLSPFLTDVDIRKSGTIRYAPIERGSSAPGDMIMNETAAFFNECFGNGDDENAFQPTWMLVAQWERVHPHPHGSDFHEGLDEEYLNRVSYRVIAIV